MKTPDPLLRQRVVSGLVMSALGLLATLVGGPVFALVVAAVGVMVWSEWLDMTMPHADDRALLAGGVSFLAFGAIALWAPTSVMVPLALVLFVVVALWLVTLGIGVFALAGLFYAVATIVALVDLRGSFGLHIGFAAIVFLFATVWSTDIGAYFTGRKIGGIRLAPMISPGKTVSGALGGVAAAVIAGLVVRLFLGLPLTVGETIWLSVLLSVASQAGDLFESHMKRRAGVKNSSEIIPGHGGVMDRVDGLVFAAVLLWLTGALAAAKPLGMAM